MSRKLPLALFLAVSLLLPGVALAAPPNAFPAGSSGIGDPYFPLDGNGGYDVQHYDLDVSYDPDTDELIGEATIQAQATQNLSAFNLDFVGMQLHSLTVNGVAARTHTEGPGADRQADDGDHQRFRLHGRGALRRCAADAR